MDTFLTTLNQLTVSELKQRLPLLQDGRKPTKKIDIINYIHNDILQNHQSYWNKLSSLEKKAVAETMYQVPDEKGDLGFNAYRFKAKYDELPQYFIRRYSYSLGANKKKEKISYLPIFFYYGAFPHGLYSLMQHYVEKPEALGIATIAEDKLPKTIHHDLHDYHKKGTQAISDPQVKIYCSEERVVYEIETLLRFVETGKCTVSEKTLRATTATLGKIDELLLEGDYYLPEDDWNLPKYAGSTIHPIRAFAWPLLLQASGLAKRVGKKLQLTAKGKKALKAPLHETVLLLYQCWRNKKLLDEFSRIEVIKGQASKGRVMTAIPERKKVIENLLQQCPVDEWIPIDNLFRYIKANGSKLQICHQEWKLYIADREYGNLANEGSFEMIEGRYILVYFFEYLATMGLIDMAYTVPYLIRKDYSMWGTDDLSHLSRYDGLLYFRINPLGAYCLGLAQQYQPRIIEKPALLTIDSELHIRLLRKATAAEMILLERYAEPLSDDKWELTEDKILQVMADHFPIADFQRFLAENNSESELPEQVKHFFTLAHNRENSLVDLGNARLLRCYNVAFAKMLATHTTTKKYCMYTEGVMLVIPEKTKKQFIKGLQKLGYVYPQEKK